MKQIMYNIMVCCVAVLFFTACDTNNDIVGGNAVEDGNSIILDLSSSSLPLGRAIEATGAEVKVDHIDVLIFDEAGSKKYHERVGGSETGKGTIALKAKRNSFTKDDRYWVYLIANSKADESVFAADEFDRSELLKLTQEDRDIHMTGYPSTTVDVPQVFLMDGIAYPADNEEPALTAVAPVVLYDGDDSNDTKLKATLRRAAAKIVVRINKGEFVEFYNETSTLAGYYLRNMPYTTSVVTGGGAEASLRTPDLTDNEYFKWTQATENGPYTLITVTAYTYAHSWDNESALEKETRLIVNIPIKYTPHDADGNSTGDPIEYSNSYYQIPVCRGTSLERNTYYEVSLTLNVPGGTNPLKPVTIEPTNYEVLSWDEKTIDIGGDTESVAYLYVNEEEMEMHNIAEDNTTLWFASSSAVTATIKRVYYEDKFGDEKDLVLIANSDGEYQVNTGTETNPVWVKDTIRITPDGGINGKIDVYSSRPKNNTIRYIVFEVENEEGKKHEVTIEQYPLVYITHVVGKYSYRSDFGAAGEDGKPTTYEMLNGNSATDGKVTSTSQIDQRRVACYYKNGWQYESRWRYDYSTSQQNNRDPYSFFGSKVAEYSSGSYSIYYYHWDQSGSNNNYTYTVTTNETLSSSSTVNVNGTNFYGDKTSLTNPRMYHVQITATSGSYTLGKPHLTVDGYTESGADNAVLVSPSFMIASQLGATTTADDIDIAKEHCKRYVEVAEDGTKYEDWRLPTRAEIEIINKFQHQSDAMDEVLTAKTYWCADGGTVTILDKNGNESSSTNTQILRCIRDAYDDK